jgi:hypothetical protein
MYINGTRARGRQTKGQPTKGQQPKGRNSKYQTTKGQQTKGRQTIRSNNKRLTGTKDRQVQKIEITKRSKDPKFSKNGRQNGWRPLN